MWLDITLFLLSFFVTLSPSLLYLLPWFLPSALLSP
nr:MAG TPA: hypothetical protein [Caudoviricetes sp.]